MGVLETGEVSDGNEVLAMGERDLFQHLAEKNINNFNAAGVEKIIALSPHGFNALKNEYPQFGGTYSVSHYSQVLTSLCETLVFQPDLPPLRVTYHDSCYLGRHNHEYWSVRQLLQVMPGIETLEMDRNLQNALCCGGGGGNLYTDMLGSGPGSAARARIREAADSGAQVLVTACPTCAVMFDDAIKQENLTDRLAVREISELINERLTGDTDL
jgi:Fe-S oxidoreductase